MAVTLLGAFFLHITPRDLIHQLAGHQDTVHTHIFDDIAFSGKHQHCDFLQIGVEPYEQAHAWYFTPSRQVVWIYTLPYVPAAEKARRTDASLRAPPALA